MPTNTIVQTKLLQNRCCLLEQAYYYAVHASYGMCTDDDIANTLLLTMYQDVLGEYVQNSFVFSLTSDSTGSGVTRLDSVTIGIGTASSTIYINEDYSINDTAFRLWFATNYSDYVLSVVEYSKFFKEYHITKKVDDNVEFSISVTYNASMQHYTYIQSTAYNLKYVNEDIDGTIHHLDSICNTCNDYGYNVT